MKLSASIGTSIGCGAVIAAAAWHSAAQVAGPGSWQHAALAGMWVLFGGPGGIGVLAYAVLSFGLLTAGALHDLDRVRTRVAQASVDPKQMPEAWHEAVADTDFAALGAHLPGEDLTIAPLALLRVLRHEIWRIYGKRLLATQLVTIGLAVALAAAPALGPIMPAPTGAMRLGEILAVLALAVAVGSWLLVDGAIHRLAMAVSALAGAWEATLRTQPPAPLRRGPTDGAGASPRSETIVAAIDRLAEGVAARSWGETDAASAALASVEAAVRDSTARQEALIGGLCETLTTQIGVLARAIELRADSSGGELDGTSEALTQLAAAVDRLADPLLRRMRMLDAADRKLHTVLRRQEEAVGSVGTKWGELVAALQAMSTGLDRFARAASARQDQDQHLLPGGAGEPNDFTEELQELLDEMSDADNPRPRRSTS